MQKTSEVNVDAVLGEVYDLDKRTKDVVLLCERAVSKYGFEDPDYVKEISLKYLRSLQKSMDTIIKNIEHL